MAITKNVQMHEIDPTKRYLFTLVFDDDIDANDDFCEMHRSAIRKAMIELGCSPDNIRFVCIGHRKNPAESNDTSG